MARRVTRLGTALDVHVVSDEKAAQFPLRLPQLRGVSLRWRFQAMVLMSVLLPIVTVVLAILRSRLDLSSDLLVYLLVIVLTSVVGGLYPALVAAIVSVAAADFFFIMPLHSFEIVIANDVVALVVYLATAVLVSWTSEVSARRRRLAARASAQAAVVTSMASAVLRGEGQLPRLLELVRETFGLEAVSLLERPDRALPIDGGWAVTASSGDRRLERPEQATTQAVLDLRPSWPGAPGAVAGRSGDPHSLRGPDRPDGAAAQAHRTGRRSRTTGRERAQAHRAGRCGGSCPVRSCCLRQTCSGYVARHTIWCTGCRADRPGRASG